MASPIQRRISPRKKIASPIKKGRRSVSFNWDKKLTMVLLEICAEFQTIRGKKQEYKWPQILEQFQERTQIDIEVGVLRKRLEVVRKHYQIWRRLKGSETGLVIDPITGQIEADPIWWKMKIKEDRDFKRFRVNGVPPDMEALWDEVFGDTYATGEHCAVPGMDTTPDTPSTVGENDPDLDVLEGIDPSIFTNINEGDRGNPTHAAVHSSPSPSLAAPRRMSNANKRPRLSRAACAFQDAVSELRDEGRRTYELIENIVKQPPSAEHSTLDPDQQLKDAYDMLYQMVEEGLIEGGTNIFCFAASKILDENGRKGFMLLKSNAHRFAWLEYQMKKE